MGVVTGFGFTVTGLFTVAAQVLAVMVSVTLTDPAPGVDQVTVIALVPCPVAMVPPVAVHV